MFITAPEIEINGKVIPQFSQMKIDNGVDKWYNQARVNGAFAYDKGVREYIDPTLPDSRVDAVIRMDGEVLFTGFIVAADYGYSSSGGFYNLELFNYTQLLQSNKENLEQRKEQSYRQIIDWLITGLDYITIKYECGGAENDIVEVFDLGATEQIIAGIKRLVARKGWGVYTNNEGELVIRDWKMNNGVQTVIQEGGNVLTSQVNTNIKGLFKRYVVYAKKDTKKAPTGGDMNNLIIPAKSKDKDDDTILYTRGESIDGVIDKESTYIHKLSSSVSVEEAEDIANNILRKEVANKNKYEVAVVNIKDMAGKLYRLGDLTEFNSKVFWRSGEGGVLLIKQLTHEYSLGDRGRSTYQTKMTLVNDELYGNVINPVQVKKSNTGDDNMAVIMNRSGGGNNQDPNEFADAQAELNRRQ